MDETHPSTETLPPSPCPRGSALPAPAPACAHTGSQCAGPPHADPSPVKLLLWSTCSLVPLSSQPQPGDTGDPCDPASFRSQNVLLFQK